MKAGVAPSFDTAEKHRLLNRRRHLISCSGEDEKQFAPPSLRVFAEVFASRSEWQRLFIERR
jgi:hypothetical protein